MQDPISSLSASSLFPLNRISYGACVDERFDNIMVLLCTFNIFAGQEVLPRRYCLVHKCSFCLKEKAAHKASILS